MLSSSVVQIDLITHKDVCVFSRRAVGNTLCKTINTAKDRHINLDHLSLERTIAINNRHLKNKIQNIMIIHSDKKISTNLLSSIHSLGHWGDYFSNSYLGIKEYMKNPFFWNKIIMDGEQSSDHSLLIISKMFISKSVVELIVMTDKKIVQNQFQNLKISQAPKNFNPSGVFLPAY